MIRIYVACLVFTEDYSHLFCPFDGSCYGPVFGEIFSLETYKTAAVRHFKKYKETTPNEWTRVAFIDGRNSDGEDYELNVLSSNKGEDLHKFNSFRFCDSLITYSFEDTHEDVALFTTLAIQSSKEKIRFEITRFK